MKKILFIASICIAKYSSAQWIGSNPIQQGSAGNIAIGFPTYTPVSLLQVKNGSVLFDGTTGTTPISGSGTRMMWVPAKGAFRAGLSSLTGWDDANIGLRSFAVGSSTVASGSFSVAAGTTSTASGAYSFAAGNNTTASNSGTFAFGFASVASGSMCAAFGNTSIAQSCNSFVIGRYNNTSGSYSPTAWNLGEPLFVIGNGMNAGALSNALVVLKNGNMGMGTDTPAEKLSIETTGSAMSVKTTHPADWGYNSVLSVNLNNTKALTIHNTSLTGGYAECFKVMGSGQTEIINKLPTNYEAIGLYVGERSMYDAYTYNPFLAKGKMYVFQSSNSEYAAVFHNNGGSGPGVLIQSGSGTGSGAAYPLLRIVSRGSSPGDPAYDVFRVDGFTNATYAREIIVNLNTSWPDYVFEPTYDLKPIAEVETYLKINKHLPEMPSQNEVETEGINVAKMDALLLKKIEELTLYIIETNKKMELISIKNKELAEALSVLKNK